jgi:N-acetylmuramoyl-L-alanine amidase
MPRAYVKRRGAEKPSSGTNLAIIYPGDWMSDDSLFDHVEPPFEPLPEEEESLLPESEEEEQDSHQPFRIWSSIQSIVVTAFLLASLFTLFTPNNLFSGEMFDRIFQAWQANPRISAPVQVNTPATPALPIGIVSGHYKNDSGALCPDGLTEEQVNLKIASLVQQKLMAEGYTVDLLEEFDDRLSQYKALALVSIHADTCDFISNEATGFKVAAAIHSVYPDKATRLTLCMADRYAQTTGLTYHPNAASEDMTYYHAFDEIHSTTTAVIIETGFLNLDRQILTENADLVAQGIVNGLLCFIRNENVTLVQPTPVP